MTAVLFDGQSSFLSSFLFETLLMALGLTRFPSPSPSPVLPPLSYELPLPLSFASHIHFYKNDRQALGKADGKIRLMS